MHTMLLLMGVVCLIRLFCRFMWKINLFNESWCIKSECKHSVMTWITHSYCIYLPQLYSENPNLTHSWFFLIKYINFFLFVFFILNWFDLIWFMMFRMNETRSFGNMGEILAEKMLLKAHSVKECNIWSVPRPSLFFLTGYCSTSIGGRRA